MLIKQTQKSSLRESIKAVEADIKHANSMAAALPRDSGQDCLFQMKVSYSPFAPLLFFLIEWMDYSCLDCLPSWLGLFHILVYKVYVDDVKPKISSQERRASLREFYAVIYPSLKQLEGAVKELMEDSYQRAQGSDMLSNERLEEKISTHKGVERDDECGICMEIGSQVVLPNCGHPICISCYNEWFVRSQSCPFCRDSLKRLSSADLWILIGNCDVVDTITLAKENLRQFYLYIDKLPFMVPADNSFLSFDYMI
ncbi:hypothetical protein ACH5RR_030791 [Cinchona calisaya]|uniref:RING-type domain-containing protein n=1 Tax=Cinchona calisaya TaxID=153742 RepID=A0ABD2YZ97_9GENT